MSIRKAIRKGLEAGQKEFYRQLEEGLEARKAGESPRQATGSQQAPPAHELATLGWVDGSGRVFRDDVTAAVHDWLRTRREAAPSPWPATPYPAMPQGQLGVAAEHSPLEDSVPPDALYSLNTALALLQSAELTLRGPSGPRESGDAARSRATDKVAQALVLLDTARVQLNPASGETRPRLAELHETLGRMYGFGREALAELRTPGGGVDVPVVRFRAMSEAIRLRLEELST